MSAVQIKQLFLTCYCLNVTTYCRLDLQSSTDGLMLKLNKYTNIQNKSMEY